MNISKLILVFFTLFLSSLYSTARAGIIDSIDFAGGPGLGSYSGLLLLSNGPNNDNVVYAGGVNAVGLDEINFDHVGYIDLVFNVSGSGGVTEYSAWASVFNYSSSTWTSFTIELGFGTGSSFQLAGSGSGLDFDYPDFDSSASSVIFGLPTVSANTLYFDNGSMPFGFVDAVFYDIDVPDGIAQFTIRYTPGVQSVPAPIPVLLLLPGLCVIALRRKIRLRG